MDGSKVYERCGVGHNHEFALQTSFYALPKDNETQSCSSPLIDGRWQKIRCLPDKAAKPALSLILSPMTSGVFLHEKLYLLEFSAKTFLSKILS
jgi:hypothetical protein